LSLLLLLERALPKLSICVAA